MDLTALEKLDNSIKTASGMPEKVILGEKSGYITERELPIIAAYFSKAKVVAIANAGHWLHAENPKDFYNSVVDFLAS